ncbi:hypothetical protein [Ileibacterium valens]|uniref:hypothetical protein n=1 Tax=Ileibacterium valens TaxID=1862668 RepID=UPI0025728000|nr:hypothetical protein [Ileibacterium valens]
MPTKKDNTAEAVKETKTTKTAAKKATGGAAKTKAASETVKKAAAKAKKAETESAPAIAKEKKKNAPRAKKAAAKTTVKEAEVAVEATVAAEAEASKAKETVKKAEPKKTAAKTAKAATKTETVKEIKIDHAETDKAEAPEAVKEKVKPAAKQAVIKRPKAELTTTEEKPAKKAPAKKAAAKTAKTAEKTVEVKEAEAKVPAKKAAAKKAAAKKAESAKKAAKAETPVEEAPAKKETPVKEEVKAVEEVKETAAPEVKEEVKVEVEAKPEKEVRKPAPELTEEKLAAYRNFELGTLLEMAAAEGMTKTLDELKYDLSHTLDVEGYTTNAVLEALNSGNEYNFDDDGFDVTVIPVIMKTIYDSLPYKASEASDLEKQVHDALEMNLGQDGKKNGEVYDNLMNLVRQILEVGQKQNKNTLEEAGSVIPGDLRGVITHFMDVAYDLLPYWSYDDVKFYEGFIYAVISQFVDLKDLENRAMMDVADLYIKHGDYGRGDAEYNYVIRENQLKDQIYFRFANVYRNFDPQKAKSIAASSLQYVDGRYDYYPRIMEILNS